MLWTHWFCTHCFPQLSRHVHDHFSVVLEVLHLLLSEHEFPLLHGSPKHDVKPFLWNFVQTAFDVLHGHGVKRLLVPVVCTTRDLHTDAHLEHVLVLVLCLQLTMFLCFLLHVLIPAVGYAHFCFCTCSFFHCRSALFSLDLLTSRRYWLMLLWHRLICLSGPVSGLPLPASPLARADSHNLCSEALVVSRT